VASGVFTHFGPGPNGTIRFQTRFEDDTGRIGDSDRFVEPQVDILSIPWAALVAAGYGTLEYQEDGTASIRRVDDQAEDGDRSMNDDTAPAWAGALLQAMNDRFDQVDAKLTAVETQLDRIAAKREQVTDELDQVNAAMDRVIAKMTGRTP
jgi:uncharacterized protein YukE